jgi:hypothetical protein
MRALLAAEIRRMSSRRLVRVAAGLAILGIAIAAVVVAVTSTDSPSPFGLDRRFHLTELRGALEGTSPILVILGWFLGASAIGADWHTGMVTTLLTWEPRRIRLMMAKLAAAAGVVFVLVLFLQALLAAGLTAAAVLRGTTGGTDGTWLRGVVGIALRVEALAGVGAAVGFAIASAARNTGAALGVGFAYTLVVENLVRALRPHWAGWLMTDNAVVFVTGQPTGFAVQRSTIQAGLLLGAYAAALVGAATVAFRTRDVT